MLVSDVSTKLGQLSAELTKMNPWWARPQGWQALDVDLKPAEATGLHYRPSCLDDLEPGSLYLLRGPRRVGKTVTVKQTIDQLLRAGVPPLHIVRVAVDGWKATDLRTVIQNVPLPPTPPGHHRWWFIDEVTAVDGDWATQIKWLRDNDPSFRDATVVLTGSSAGDLTAAAGVLAGRRGTASTPDRTLLPMGMRTFAELLSADIAALPHLPLADLHTPAGQSAYYAALPWLADLVPLFELYLRYGGFPASVAAARTGNAIPGWFINDLFAVIHRDAFSASQLSEQQTAALAARLWESTSTPANLSNIGQDLGVSQAVVSRHVGYLRDAYLLWSCPQKDDAAWHSRPKAQEKLYPIDPLVARLGHLRNKARPDVDTTVLAEAQVGLALRRQLMASGRAWGDDETLFYHRTPTRKEVDFVSEDLAGAAVEGKFVEDGGWRKEAQTVEASPWKGLLITRNVLDVGEVDGAWAVPGCLLAALVDT